jgi:hypothetical protein
MRRLAICLAVVACAANAQPLVEPDAGSLLSDDAGIDAGVIEEVDAGVVDVAPIASTTEAAPAPEEAAEPKPALGHSPHHAFRAWVGGGFFTRDLYFSGNELGRQREPAAGSINAGVSLFPGAAFTSNALAHLGAFFTADFGAGMRGRSPVSGAVFAESGSRLRFGVQGRIPANDDIAIVLQGSWSRHAMDTADISIDGNSRRTGTNVLFNGLRLGASIQCHLWERLSAEFNLSGQYLLYFGDLTQFYPGTTGVAFDTGLVFSVELLPNLFARASFEWQRYFLNFHPQAGAAYTAPSGFDNYVWLNAGLMLSM